MYKTERTAAQSSRVITNINNHLSIPLSLNNHPLLRHFVFGFSQHKMNAMGKPTLIGLLLTATALATPTRNAKHCVDLEIPVPVSASNYQIDAPRVDSNSDAVDWVRNITTWDSPNITERIIGRIPVNDTFSIRGRLCVPVDGKKKDILQIATHGIAFNQQ